MIQCYAKRCDRSAQARGLCLMHYKRWKRNGDPNVRQIAERGKAFRVSRQGYVEISEGSEHRVIATKALGRELRGTEVVHHVDFNKSNNRNSNLVICPDATYHAFLHTRTEALEASGDPRKRKCFYCQKWDHPENLYIRRRKPPKGWETRHRYCHAKYISKRKLSRGVK